MEPQMLTPPEILGLVVFFVLIIWIPISVWRSRRVISEPWKRWAWCAANCIPGVNLLSFLGFLRAVVWKGSSGLEPRWRKWLWRTSACLPPLNPAVLPLFLHRERSFPPDTVKRVEHLRGVTTLYSAITLVGFGLILFGRAPAVDIGPDGRVSESFATHLQNERQFITGDKDTPPDLCVSLSGGGIRSAAFSLGVLQGLHEMRVLPDVDVISAVSGGTYALSWLVLQPYNRRMLEAAEVTGTDPVESAIEAMFADDGVFQEHLEQNSAFVERQAVGGRALLDMTFGQLLKPITVLFGRNEELLNGTATRKLYAGRIQQTFHGYPTRRSDGHLGLANALTLPKNVESLPSSMWVVRNTEFSSDAEPRGLFQFLRDVSASGKRSMPYPVFNAALNANVSSALGGQIWPYHFELTPLGLGGPALGYVEWGRLGAPEFNAIRSVNIAPAVSGAAISGYAQAGFAWLRPLIRFFNLDLGYYVPNFYDRGPRSIYLSDGGHSENLGLYALIRRQCRTIIAVDAEFEGQATGVDRPRYVFEGFTKLADAVRAEKLGEVTLNDGDPRETFKAGEPVREGKVTHEHGQSDLVYIKLALDRERIPASLREYVTPERSRFPHDPTTNQDYVPAQFRAYKALGHHVACNSLALQRWHQDRCNAG